MELFSKIEEVRIVPVVVFNNASETIPTLNAMKEALGVDDSIVNSILESVDGRMIAYDNYVSPLWCILIVAFTTIVLFSLYSLLVLFKKDKRK